MRVNKRIVLSSVILALAACESDEKTADAEEGGMSMPITSAGEMTAGEASAGEMTAGEASASEMSAGEASASEMSAGEASAGERPGSQSMSGFTHPEDLAMSYSQVGIDAQEVVNAYCNECAMSELCAETLFDTMTSVDDATCMIENSDETQLTYLASLISCEGASVTAMSECVEMASACNDEQLTECLYLYGAECDYDYGYIAQLDYACFDGPEPFTCASGDEVIPSFWVCDEFPDCADESDEPDDCPEPFICEDGLSIPNSWACDGEADCTGGEDEANCSEGE